MNCPVCNGSGLSPGVAERLGMYLPCGGCDGTGVRREWPDEEPTGALDSAAAFDRHYESIFGTRKESPREDYTSLDGVKLDLAAMEIDRRYMAELPNTIIGRTTAQTAENLEAIADDYRRLGLECHRALMLDRERVDRKIADTVSLLGQARENLGELSAAEHAYREAEELYTALGATAEAGREAANLASLQLRTGRDVDSAFESLHSRLDHTVAPLDLAELKLDLADLHFGRNDDFGAEEHLREADKLLAPHAHRASGTATAEALAASLSQLLNGGELTPIDETVRVRTLLGRLYRGLARVWPDQAAGYEQRLLQLEGSVDQGSTENADFSDRMRKLMEDMF